MSAITLAERVVEIESALSEVSHAFGGALALAYYADPRATIDIDLNLFVPPDDLSLVAGPLQRLGITVGRPAVAALIQRDGQARAMWDATPIDLFFAYDPFHFAAEAARTIVPFAGTTITILAAAHLMVCKAVFNRSKDWVDIESMLAGGAYVDTAEVLRWVGRLVGDDDPRYVRIVSVLTRR
jgi:hypothetical protein